jgi:hypothetical protein
MHGERRDCVDGAMGAPVPYRICRRSRGALRRRRRMPALADVDLDQAVAAPIVGGAR